MGPNMTKQMKFIKQSNKVLQRYKQAENWIPKLNQKSQTQIPKKKLAMKYNVVSEKINIPQHQFLFVLEQRVVIYKEISIDHVQRYCIW